MLFIRDLEVNIKLLLMTFVDDIVISETAKTESPGQPDVTNCTAWLGQTNHIASCNKMFLANMGKNQDKHCNVSFGFDP